MDATTDLNQLAKSNNLVLENKNDDLNQIDADFEFENYDDDIPAHIKEARINELKMKMREQQFIQENKTSSYKDLTEEEFLNVTTKTAKCLVHFYHNDFRRCDIMHTHLQKLALKYLDVRFAKINVDKAKFFVNKLQIQMLPAVLCFVDGILKHRIIGFEQLGNTDNFPTELLEKRLWKLDFLKRPDNEYDEEDEGSDSEDRHQKRANRKFRQSKQNANDESDSD